MDAKQAIELGKKNGAVMVDLKFIDLPGKWQHTTVPFRRLEPESFEEGFGFDGSSIRGFQPINESDMLLIPDPRHGAHGSVHEAPHAVAPVYDPGHDHAPEVHA